MHCRLKTQGWTAYLRRYKGLRSVRVTNPGGSHKTYIFEGGEDVELYFVDRLFIVRWSSLIAQVAFAFPELSVYDTNKEESLDEWAKNNISEDDIDNVKQCLPMNWLPLGSEISLYASYKDDIEDILINVPANEIIYMAYKIVKLGDADRDEYHSTEGLFRMAMFRIAMSVIVGEWK